MASKRPITPSRPSRPIISKPIVTGDEPDSLHVNGAPQAPQRDGASRRSSTSRASSRESKTATRSASAQSQRSSRGRKGYQLSKGLDRVIIKVLDTTDVAFDRVAQALENSGGPQKLWLRKRIERFTDTKSFSTQRLNSDKASAEDRKQRQLWAKEYADALDELGLDQSTTSVPDGLHRPPSTVFPTTSPTLGSWARRSRQSSNAATLTTFDNDDALGSSSSRRKTDSWTGFASKRQQLEDVKDGPTAYVSKGNRTRALSESSFIHHLEKLTGNTGLYEFIRRASYKSHLSPLFRSARWSRGSRATSGRVSYPSGNGACEVATPVDYRHFNNDPDPDYENFYHAPQLGAVETADMNGASAVAVLLRAKTSSYTDREARMHLANSLPNEPEDRKAFVNQPDVNGITPLHLAVAYGFPHVCVLLMRNGADPRAITLRGSSCCRFGKPAQELAGEDIPLYHRILCSRQWVCAGKEPRLGSGSGSEDKVSPTYKRFRSGEAVPTLSTVPESTVPESDTRPQEFFRNDPLPGPSSGPSSGLTPLVTDLDFSGRVGVDSSHSRFSFQPSSVFGTDESPNAYHIDHCMRDHNSIYELPTPDSDPRSAAPWSMNTSSLESQFTFPTTYQAQRPLQQEPEPITSHPQNPSQAPFGGGLGITTGGEEARLSTSWQEPYFLASQYQLENTNNFETHSQPMNPLVDNGPISQMTADVQHFQNHDAFSSSLQNQDQYTFDPSGQHYPPRSAAQGWHMMTPPDEPRPSMRHDQPSQQWMGQDVSNATRALARRQEFSTFAGLIWPQSDGQDAGRNEGDFYDQSYHQPPNHHYHQ